MSSSRTELMLVDADERTQHCVVENSVSLSTISNQQWRWQSTTNRPTFRRCSECSMSNIISSNRKPITSTTSICSSNENCFPVLVKNSLWAKLLLQSSNLNNYSVIRYVKRIKISGRICYVLGSVFLRFLPVLLNESVQFFRISDLLVSDERIFFVM